MQFKKFVSLALIASLAGCASLPTSGPTGKQIQTTAAAPDMVSPIPVVEITKAEDLPAPAVESPSALAELLPPPTDMIGPGDVLDVSIYEAGVTLFGGGASGAAGGQAAQLTGTPGVQVQKLPPLRVNDDGDIAVPYAGKLHVLGHTSGEVETMIQRSLRGISQSPQVLVSVSTPITNSVIVGGEVGKPGRLVLQTNRETLSDVIALAGGYRGSAKDLTLRVFRRGQVVDISMTDLTENSALDVRAYPGDRYMLVNTPRTFSVLGAPGRVEQLPLSRAKVSLAEAIANAGGVNPNAGDPAAIFVFRYVKDEQGADTPVVYHINMMKTSSYFLAQRFAVRDKDILYIGNAAANQPSKLVQLISQLFSPILTVTSAVQTVQNSNN